ncbi:MAG: Lrp/AsnC family transcriptional regulator [Acidaminococcaceae bacterium]
MDNIDKAILNELTQNARMPVSEISKKVSLSIPAVAERIRKLEQNNIIEKYTIKINRQKVEQKLLAFILVNIDSTENIQHFRDTITQSSCVLECHHVAGNHDYLLKVISEDTLSLERFLSKTLKNIKGVVSSNTIISLLTLKEELNT